MWCAGCAIAAEKVLLRQPGISSADVSFAAEKGQIQYDPQNTDLTQALKKLDALGYQTDLISQKDEKKITRMEESVLLQLIAALGFEMQIMILYLGILYPGYLQGNFNSPLIRQTQFVVWALATPLLFYGGVSFLRGAWRAMVARTATMDTLVTLGTLSAYGYSVYVTIKGNGQVYFDSLSMIIVFIMVGRYLEKIGGARTRKSIRRLLSLQPENAWVKREGQWEQISSSRLIIGEEAMVKTGERVPADGIIIRGQASLDESLLSGESVLAMKKKGDKVLGGTVVTDAPIFIRVTHPVGTTRLSQITQLVEKTLSNKPPVQRIADRASAVFTFVILSVAILSGIGWGFFGPSDAKAILTAVSVLVVACPCALGLATPLAITMALGRAVEAGILIRNPGAIEDASKVKRLVFDKTGTLTQGRMSFVEIVVDSSLVLSKAKLLKKVAAVEQYSEHPIAKAILDKVTGVLPAANNFHNLRGLGATATVGGQPGERLMIGSASFLGIKDEESLYQRSKEYSAQGDTVVWIGNENMVLGFMVLRDEIDPKAIPVIKELRRAGMIPSILSGDNPLTTKYVAGRLGIEDFEGGCSPEDKSQRILAWQQKGEKVAMIGDGVNDAPALAQADLAFTVAGGTDIAGETSDVVLTQPDLNLIPLFISLARSTRKIISQNLAWAFGYNVVSVPLAVTGLISPVIASAAMTVSSLLVVGNSMRLGQGLGKFRELDFGSSLGIKQRERSS